MPQKEWTITLADLEYTITLKHGTLLRKYDLKLNGDTIKPKRALIEKGDKLIFNIGLHTCFVIIYFQNSGFKYDCIIDDISIETAQKTEIPADWSPPKEGCLKHNVYWFLGVVLIGLVSALTGISEDKIDLVLILIVVTLVIYAIVQHFKKKA